MKIGDKVRVERMPDGLPHDNKQLQTLFRGCLGKTFPIVKFDGDLVELHVGEVFGKPADYHQIWLEQSQVKLIEA
jgi:hypothetical protein